MSRLRPPPVVVLSLPYSDFPSIKSLRILCWRSFTMTWGAEMLPLTQAVYVCSHHEKCSSIPNQRWSVQHRDKREPYSSSRRPPSTVSKDFGAQLKNGRIPILASDTATLNQYGLPPFTR